MEVVLASPIAGSELTKEVVAEVGGPVLNAKKRDEAVGNGMLINSP
jgi:hypothetical protein